MNDWKHTTMAEVMLEFHDGPHATPAEADSGPVYLGIKNITDSGALDLSDYRPISEDDFAHWTRRVEPRPNDVVFTYEATLHRYALIPQGFRGCLGRRIALIRPDTAKVVPRYLHYAMLGPQWRNTVTERIISGSTVDRIPIKTFPTFPISIPPLATQQNIADILGSIDDLIENNRRQIEILEEMAQAIYREWFVHFRFPGHQDATFVDSPLGPIPEGWEVRKASEALSINPRTKALKEVEDPFFTMGDIDERSLVCFPSESKSGSSGSRFLNGDTLFARITPCLENGKTGYVAVLDEGQVGRGSTEFIVLRGLLVGPAFTYFLARSPEFRGHAIASMSGASGRQRVRNECFDSYELAAPPRDLVAQFEHLASPAMNTAFSLARQNHSLVKVRDLLLPKLVTGEIDVSSLDLDALIGAPS